MRKSGTSFLAQLAECNPELASEIREAIEAPPPPRPPPPPRAPYRTPPPTHTGGQSGRLPSTPMVRRDGPQGYCERCSGLRPVIDGDRCAKCRAVVEVHHG